MALLAISWLKLGVNTSSTILGPSLNWYLIDLGSMVPSQTSHVARPGFKLPGLQAVHIPLFSTQAWRQAAQARLAIAVP